MYDTRNLVTGWSTARGAASTAGRCLLPLGHGVLQAVYGGPAGGEQVVSSGTEAQHHLELLRQTVRTIYRPLLWRKAAELELTRPQAQVLHYIAK